MKGNVKKTFFTLALILVPIFLLLFVVAIAIACLLFWESHRRSNRNRNRRWRRCAIWNRVRTDPSNKSSNADTPRVSVSTKATNTTEFELEFQKPVQVREHV
jgi:flagellar basal body-associated protein FliL